MVGGEVGGQVGAGHGAHVHGAHAGLHVLARHAGHGRHLVVVAAPAHHTAGHPAGEVVPTIETGSEKVGHVGFLLFTL